MLTETRQFPTRPAPHISFPRVAVIPFDGFAFRQRAHAARQHHMAGHERILELIRPRPGPRYRRAVRGDQRKTAGMRGKERGEMVPGNQHHLMLVGGCQAMPEDRAGFREHFGGPIRRCRGQAFIAQDVLETNKLITHLRSRPALQPGPLQGRRVAGVAVQRGVRHGAARAQRPDMASRPSAGIYRRPACACPA